jgi:hypothetical protein
MHDVRRTVKSNMLEAGVGKTHGNSIMGHSLERMDRHDIKPSAETLRQPMARYTAWLNRRIGNVDPTVGHEAVLIITYLESRVNLPS